MPDPEDQQHLHGPAPDSPNHGKPLHHRFGIHGAELVHRRDLPAGGVNGQVADRAGLGFGKSGSPQPAMMGGEHRPGIEGPAPGIERAKPLEDGFGGLAR